MGKEEKEVVEKEEIKDGDEGLVEALNKEIEDSKVEETKETEEKVEEKKEEKLDEKVETKAKEKKEKVEKKEEKKEEVIEDPEYDLGLDNKEQPLKFKRSQILEFQKGSMLQADYTKKTQELAAEKANIKEVIEIVDYLKKNPKKAEKIVNILEAKEEEVKEKTIDLKAEISNIDKLLADLPDDDPYGKALRSQKAITQETLRVNKQLQSRLDQLDSNQQTDKQSKLNAEAKQVLTDTLASKQKELKFSDKEEADYWERLTLTHIVNSPKEYLEMNKEQFTEYFNTLGDKIYADIQKIGEKYVNKYIKSKASNGKVPEVGAGAAPSSVKKEPITKDNLQEALEQELKDIQDKT